VRSFISLRRLPHTLLILLATFSISLSNVTQAAEKMTAEQVALLVPQLFRLHLREKRMDTALMKRLLKEVVNNLDPAKTMFTKAEADAITNLPDEELKKLAERALAADLSHFKALLETFLKTQIVRDNAFYDGIDNRFEEVKAILKEVDAKAEADLKKEDAGEATAKGDDPDDEIKWNERAPDNAEREKRILRAVATMYRINKSYLTDAEAFKLSCQTIKQDRVRWSKVNVDNEVPKLFLKSFMSAMDPHTVYFDAEEDEEFTGRLEPSFAGIGVQIRPCPLGAQVEEVIKGGPAEKSGRFAKGDQIIRVDEFVLAGLPINKIVRRIKGERGSEVKLTVLKKATKETEIIAIKRDTINLGDMRVKGKAYDTPAGRIGVVSAQAFYRGADMNGGHENGVSEDVRDRILELEKEKPLAGLVLDLRDNHGGYLEEAVQMAGLFIKSGPVVGEKDGRGGITWKKDNDDKSYFDKPLVVLVNQFSASASEIVAGSLKDLGRAVVVGGTPTFGKGTVQRVIPLSNLNLPGEIKITTHQYFIAGGGSVQQRGVDPDVSILGGKLMEDMLERANENCVPWAQIKSDVDPAKMTDVATWQAFKQKNVPQLQENSKSRIAGNKEYQDFYNIKLRREKALAKQKELEKDPNAVAEDKKEDAKDFQVDEAVNVVADMVPLWPVSSKQAAK
jgi:carboxyl-terminal processing protease